MKITLMKNIRLERLNIPLVICEYLEYTEILESTSRKNPEGSALVSVFISSIIRLMKKPPIAAIYLFSVSDDTNRPKETKIPPRSKSPTVLPHIGSHDTVAKVDITKP